MSTPKCPYCQHPTDEDFGLVECEQCGKSFMADNPVVAVAEGDSIVPCDTSGDSAVPSSVRAEGVGERADSLEDEPSGVASRTNEDDEPVDDAAHGNLDSSLTAPPSMDTKVESSGAAPRVEEGSESSDDFSIGNLQPPLEARAKEGDEPIDDVARGNLQPPLGAAVALGVFLEGFDTADKEDVLRRALSDPFLVLDVGALMKRLHRGRLVIGPLTALQVSVLVQKLNHLPVRVSWQELKPAS